MDKLSLAQWDYFLPSPPDPSDDSAQTILKPP